MTRGTDEERAQFRREQDALVWRHLRWGVIGAAVFCLALVLATPIRYPNVARAHLVVPPLAVVSLLAITWLLGRIPALAVRPNLIIMPLGVGVATAVGWLAAHTGGFSSPLYFLLLVLWIFGATVLPLSVPVFLADVTTQLVTAIIVMVACGPVVPSDIPGPMIVSAGALAFCVFGGILRDRAALDAFLAKRALAALNEDLEARVQAAVAQIHDKVQERSRELAMAIERLAKTSPSRGEHLEPGTKLGDRVEIIRPLGAGGMGTVYLAIDKLTNENVAVKVLLPGAGNSDPSALRRFVAEAGAAAAIVHPAVVRTLHVDVTSDGRLYHIMEYVEGATLTRVLDTTTLSSAACARIASIIADALAAAHRASVIHRDVKPGNLIVTTSPPGVRVLDFGVSKNLSWGAQAELTATHDTLGTPEYMAPEQLLQSSSVTGAADVYSLGIVMYRALSGERPWPSVFVAAHAEREPTDVREKAPYVNPALASLLALCIAKDPSRRPTAAQLSTELTAIADLLNAPRAEVLASSLLGEGTTLAERGSKKDETISERPVARPAR